jgi:PAS domain S-box-containing protein
VQAVGRDVTERREAEMALRNSEERFRSAFDSASIGMVVVDAKGRAIQVNRAFGAMVGWDPAQLIGTSFREDHAPGRRRDDGGVRDGGAQRRRAIVPPGEAVRAPGRTHRVGPLSSALVRDARGAPLYFISQIQDITERKQAEEARRKSEERYRGLVESPHDSRRALRRRRPLHVRERTPIAACSV